MRRRAVRRSPRGRVALVFGGVVLAANLPTLVAVGASFLRLACRYEDERCTAPTDVTALVLAVVAATVAAFVAGAAIGLALDGLGVVRWMRGERPLGLAPSLDEQVRREAMDR